MLVGSFDATAAAAAAVAEAIADETEELSAGDSLYRGSQSSWARREIAAGSMLERDRWNHKVRRTARKIKMLVGNALNKSPALQVTSSQPATRALDMGPQRQVTSLGSQSRSGLVSTEQDCCSRHKISTILHFDPKASLRPTAHDG